MMQTGPLAISIMRRRVRIARARAEANPTALVLYPKHNKCVDGMCRSIVRVLTDWSGIVTSAVLLHERVHALVLSFPLSSYTHVFAHGICHDSLVANSQKPCPCFLGFLQGW